MMHYDTTQLTEQEIAMRLEQIAVWKELLEERSEALECEEDELKKERRHREHCILFPEAYTNHRMENTI